MEANTKACMPKEKEMASVYLFGKMAQNTKANGKTI